MLACLLLSSSPLLLSSHRGPSSLSAGTGSVAERFWAQNGDEPNRTELRRGRRMSSALVVAAQRSPSLVRSFADLDDSLASAPDSICTTMPLEFVLLLLLKRGEKGSFTRLVFSLLSVSLCSVAPFYALERDGRRVIAFKLNITFVPVFLLAPDAS